ncbi:UNVERIFIED_CONTAM: hypothetical protein K2H54_051957 [Gekko kuhli]
MPPPPRAVYPRAPAVAPCGSSRRACGTPGSSLLLQADGPTDAAAKRDLLQPQPALGRERSGRSAGRPRRRLPKSQPAETCAAGQQETSHSRASRGSPPPPAGVPSPAGRGLRAEGDARQLRSHDPLDPWRSRPLLARPGDSLVRTLDRQGPDGRGDESGARKRPESPLSFPPSPKKEAPVTSRAAPARRPARGTKWKRQTAVGLELLAEAGNYSALQRMFPSPYFYPQSLVSNLDPGAALYLYRGPGAAPPPALQRPLVPRILIHGLQGAAAEPPPPLPPLAGVLPRAAQPR